MRKNENTNFVLLSDAINFIIKRSVYIGCLSSFGGVCIFPGKN